MPCPESSGLAAWPAQHSKLHTHHSQCSFSPTFRAHQALAGRVRAGSRHPSPTDSYQLKSNIFFCCPWGW